MKHDQFREIFRIIDESLWEDICERDSDGWLKSFDCRIAAMRQKCDEAKQIISEYLDRYSEMMEKMITSEAFRRFPAPTAPENPQTQADLNLSRLSMLAALAASEVSQAADDHDQ